MIKKKIGGFSIVEVMVAMGILSVVTLGVMKVIKMMGDGKDRFESSARIEEGKQLLFRVLSGSSCEKTIFGEDGDIVKLGSISESDLPENSELEKNISSPIIISKISLGAMEIFKVNQKVAKYSVEQISFNKFLEGSNHSGSYFRLNLEVKLKNRKNQMRSLNFPIGVSTDPEDDNRILNCQYGFLDDVQINVGKHMNCSKIGNDSAGFGSGVCPGGKGKGLSLIKTANGNSADHGIGSVHHAKDFYTSKDVFGCINMGYDGSNFGTALCWGSGIFLIKTSDGNTGDHGNSGSWHVKQHLSGSNFVGCTSLNSDSLGLGTAVCWGEGVALIKVGDGSAADHGNGESWHVKQHQSSLDVISCSSLGYDPLGFGTAACSSTSGTLLIKTSNGDNGDRGIGSSWHVKKH